VAGAALQEKIYADVLDAKRRQIARQGRCESCWHLSRDCLCSQLQPTQLSGPERDVQILLYVHFKEYFNAGNTGKLLPLAMPSNARVFVHGDTEHEAKLREELLLASPARTLLLFPSPESRPLGGAVQLRTTSSHQHDLAPLRVLVLDGTWQHARGLRRMLARRVLRGDPLPTEVCLAPEVSRPAFWKGASSIARSQAHGDRICTAEAVALLLHELGEDDQTCQHIIKMVERNSEVLFHRRSRGARANLRAT